MGAMAERIADRCLQAATDHLRMLMNTTRVRRQMSETVVVCEAPRRLHLWPDGER